MSDRSRSPSRSPSRDNNQEPAENKAEDFKLFIGNLSFQVIFIS